MNEWSIQDERLGHPFVVTNAYKDKLPKWPKIGIKPSSPKFQKICLFLNKCGNSYAITGNLNALNDCMENQKLLTKLPDWLVSRWNREATGRMKDEKKYPDFKNFATFISAEADLLCNLISSCYAEREVERATDSTHQESKPKYEARSHYTRTMEEN